MAINPVLKEIQTKFKCISYADDIIIAHDPSVPAAHVIEYVGNLLLQRGLKLSIDKCKSTADGIITFLG
jgi:hypothetical protein